ncbi:MAG: adenylate/guanylate cyclase domain-containing protein [bacterium]
MKVSLRIKWTILVVLLVFLVTGLISGLVVRRVNEVMIREVRLRGEVLAKNLAANSCDPMMSEDDLTPPLLVKEIMKNEGVVYCYIVDNNNIINAPNSKLENKEYVIPSGLQANLNNDVLIQEYKEGKVEIIDISAPIIFGGIKRIGTVYLGLSKESVVSVIKDVQYMILTIASAGLFLGVMGAIGLAQFLLSPIKKLVNGTRAVGSGDYKFRVDVKTADEIEELSNAFNEMAENLEKKEQIEGAFRRYVSHQVADEILSAPAEYMESLKGLRSDITVLFADIRGFTSFSERFPPEKVVAILNEYLTIMTDVIFSNFGTLDKFTGDGLMAIFGAPLKDDQHAVRAVKCALDIRWALERFYMSEGQSKDFNFVEYPKVGFGINSGTAIVGNVGSANRLEYTAIGDSVNLAKRFVDISEGGQILIGENTFNLVKDYFDIQLLGKFKVKGKERTLIIYQILSSIR